MAQRTTGSESPNKNKAGLYVPKLNGIRGGNQNNQMRTFESITSRPDYKREFRKNIQNNPKINPILNENNFISHKGISPFEQPDHKLGQGKTRNSNEFSTEVYEKNTTLSQLLKSAN